jgi:tetratricopeptide (TPR) repeat protein
MANKNLVKRILILAIFLMTITVTACEPEEILLKLLERAYYSENRLIHISISKPQGWQLGSKNMLQIRSDFPFFRSNGDFAIFSHSSSRSSIFVSYKPILGISYFSADTKKVAEWFREAHLTIYKKYKEEMEKWLTVVGDSVDLYTREIGGKTFYVVKNEIFSNVVKENRAIYIFLHIPEDVKSLYMFCFSTLAGKGIEEEKPFQDLLAMVKGYKTNHLEPYDEALYRNSAKLWMANHEYHLYMDVKWHKAIMDEAIEELKKAATLRPNGWEPHYLLIMEYSSRYFLGYPTILVEGKPKVVTDIWPFSPEPINADAAIEEFKFLTRLNPDFKERSKWIFGRNLEPSFGVVYITIGRMLNKLKRYDEAIIYLQEGLKTVPTDSVIEGELQFAYRDRAKTKVEKGNYDGAIEDLKSSIAIKENRTIEYRDYQTLAEIYIKKGMKKEALEAFSKALEIVKKEKWGEEVENNLETKIKELRKQ